MVDSKEMLKMIHGLLEKVDKLQDRVTELEKHNEETSTGVYYDHLDNDYVEYIDKEITRKRRGE